MRRCPVGERCERCDKPVATDNDWVTTPEGEGEHLCWGSCASVDWRARALAALGDPNVDLDDARNEFAQVAATAVAWIEYLDRKAGR
jgi:hypothetical protein